MDLRPRRDLFDRRRLRERGRRAVRMLALMAGDAAAAAVAVSGASFRLGGGGPDSVALQAVPAAVLLVVLFQAAAGTYGPGRARMRYEAAFFFAVAAALAFVWLGHAYDFVSLSLPRAALLAASLGGLVCGVRVLADVAVRWLRRRGVAVSPTLIIGEPSSVATLTARVEQGSADHVRIVGWLAPFPRHGAGVAAATGQSNGGGPTHAGGPTHGIGRSNGAGPTNGVGHHEAHANGGASASRNPSPSSAASRNPSSSSAAVPRLGFLPDLGRVLEAHDIRSVVVSARLGAGELRAVLESCLLHGCRVAVVPDTVNEVPCQVTARDFLGWPLLELQIPRLHALQTLLKRALDLVVTVTALTAFAPFLAVLAAAVRLDSPGPILFRQRRLGVGGRPFMIYKLRTMREDAERLLQEDPELLELYRRNDYKLPTERDPRITRLGRFLRATSLDEIPQLLNVLRGEMSLVGPRPIVPDEIKRYEEDTSLFLAVRPGITGEWQVNGRSEVGYPDRAQLDFQYIKTWSLGKDLKILARTIPAVLRRNGAH